MRHRSPIQFASAVSAAVSILLFSATALADETRHYDWLTAGKVSGSHVLVIETDGTRVIDFEFNDRGRGPKLNEVLKIGDGGVLVSVAVNGHSYMGAPVDETFRVENGEAHWQSTLEKGQAAAGAFYWAHEGTLEQLAILARALLAVDSGRLDILPAGRAAIRKIAEHEDATLYAISGLDLTPRYIWLDPQNELLAMAGGWMGLAPRGRSEILPVLQEIQDKEEKEIPS